MAQNGDKVTFWRGSIKVFNKLKADGRLTANRLYFVGNSQTDSEGLRDSTYGTIYLATSANWCVRFGIFSENSDLDKIADEIYTAIEKEGAERAKADGELQEKLTAEIEERKSEDAKLLPLAGGTMEGDLKVTTSGIITTPYFVDTLANARWVKLFTITEKSIGEKSFITFDFIGRRSDVRVCKVSMECVNTATSENNLVVAPFADLGGDNSEKNNPIFYFRVVDKTFEIWVWCATCGEISVVNIAANLLAQRSHTVEWNGEVYTDKPENLIRAKYGIYARSAVEDGYGSRIDTTYLKIANAYDKATLDTLLSAKANASDVYTKTESDDLLDTETTARQTADASLQTSIETETTDRKNADDLKADKATTYTKTETNNLLDEKADASTTYSKTETDGLLSAKADASTTYTKSEVDTKVDEKADSDEVYTKTETDTKLNSKANSADVYTKTQTDTKLNSKADSSSVYTKTQIDTKLNTKADSSSLANYYTKSETYTKDEVDSLVEAKVAFQVVDALPTTGETAIIYLVPLADPETQNIYDEYMWIGGAWEHIGSTKTDLSDYYTKEETDAKLDTKANASNVYSKTETDTKLNTKADSSSVYTKTETSNLLSSKADSSSVYTKTETDTKLNAKANQSTTYTKTEVDTKLGNKANSADVYTQSQIDTKLGNKADKTALSSYYTKTESDSLLSAKQDSITGGATTITTNDLTASRVLVSDSDGKVSVSHITNAELGYMQGVTSNLQVQISSKAERRELSEKFGVLDYNKLPKIIPVHTTIHVSYSMSAPSGVGNYAPIFAPLIKSFWGVNSYTEEKFEYRVTMSDGSLLEGWIVANMYANSSVSGNYQRLIATGGGAFVSYMNPSMPYQYDLYYEGGNEGDASVYPSKIELWLPDTYLTYGMSYNIWNGTKTSETEWDTYTMTAAQEKTYSGCPWLSLGWADMTDGEKSSYCPATHSGVLNYQLNKAYNMAKGEYYTKTQTDGYLEKKEDNLNTMTTADIDTLIDSVCV